MPISADAFDAAKGHSKPSTRRRILDFLQAHRDQAFSQSELETRVHGGTDMPVGDTVKIVGILLSLEGARQIISKEILEKDEFVKYYKAV